MSKIKVIAVCGFGVGTSLLLKMNIDSVLRSNKIDADVENADIATAGSIPCDIIFTSNELYEQIKSKVNVPVVVINNFMSKDEIAEKAIPSINEILNK